MAEIMTDHSPKAINPEELERIPSLQKQSNEQFRTICLEIEGMDCSDCALVIEHRLSRLPGVDQVKVDYAQQQVCVGYDPKKLKKSDLALRISQMGYSPVDQGIRRWLRHHRDLLTSLLAGIILLGTWIGENYLGLSFGVSFLLYGIVYVLTGLPTARHALASLRERHFDTDMLMLLAALGAAALGDFAEGGLLLFLFGLGHALEDKVLDRARQSVRALGDIMPRQALVERHGEQILAPIDQISLGDTIVVRPGERIPMDGIVIKGESLVNQAPITGESLPVEMGKGSMAYAGAINGEGVLNIKVDKLARDSTLARIMALVEQAQEQKSPSQQLVERFSTYYVPAVLLIAVLLILIPPVWGETFPVSFRRSMIFLVAVSPCALAIGAPAAILAGVAQAARNGVLVKGGLHLENLGLVETLVFDKTGTLTSGKPEVATIYPAKGWDEHKVLRLAAALEQNSLHLLAQAVMTEAERRNIQAPVVEQVQMLPGLGIKGKLDNEWVFAGNERLLRKVNINFDQEWKEKKIQAEARGESFIWIGLKGEVVGMITVSDLPRSESQAVLSRLRNLGVRKMLVLSGDSHAATQKISAQVGADEFQAGLLPEEKLQALQSIQQISGKIGMVGDGVNDAPALAAADVGIAIGGAGSDVALEAADVALMAANLEKLPFAVGLGKATRKIIIQNLSIAMTVIILLAAAALSGLAGIGPVVFFHEGSTLLVVFNAMRLLKFSSV